MNGNYYPNPTFPSTTPNYESTEEVVIGPNAEQSYIENIIRMNKGKKVKIFAAFPDANDWRDKVFNGIIDEAGRDHVIIRDTEKESWYLIPIIYVNFVESDEKFIYNL